VEDERETIMAVLSKAASIASARREAIRYGIAAIMLGFVFIGVTGFAPLQAIHDAAHNTRHAVSFPCH
jgi:cobalt transporter subunit CbtB